MTSVLYNIIVERNFYEESDMYYVSLAPGLWQEWILLSIYTYLHHGVHSAGVVPGW